MAYAVPIAAPQLQGGGSAFILPAPNSNPIPYDISQEFPTDPFRLMLAWANCFWKQTSVYNGK